MTNLQRLKPVAQVPLSPNRKASLRTSFSTLSGTTEALQRCSDDGTHECESSEHLLTALTLMGEVGRAKMFQQLKTVGSSHARWVTSSLQVARENEHA